MALSNEQAQKTAERLYRKLVARRDEIQTLEDYHAGEHPLAYASKEWSKDHRDRFKGFSDNWCGVVGDAPVERMAINGFSLGTDSGILDAAEKALWGHWLRNEMDAQSQQGFLTTGVAKRSAVIVWGDPKTDEPVSTWEHPSQVIVECDPERPRVTKYTVKSWTDDDREYLNLYDGDDTLWKWQRDRSSIRREDGRTEAGIYVVGEHGKALPLSSDGWEPREDADTWPIKHGLGENPGTEFLNRPTLGNDPVSEIEGARAMQDAVNLMWAYLFVAADWASMPARVVMGQEPPKIPILDENGVKIGEQTVDVDSLKQGRMLWLTGQNASIGQWDAAKLDVFTGVVNVGVKHMAAQTRTPIHYIVGELGNVNGETLTATETPLGKKVEQIELFHSPRVRDVARKMALAAGDRRLAEACRTMTTRWVNPFIRDESQLADAASKDRAVGFPLMWIAKRRYDLSQDELVELEQMLEAESIDPYVAAQQVKQQRDDVATDAAE